MAGKSVKREWALVGLPVKESSRPTLALPPVKQFLGLHGQRFAPLRAIDTMAGMGVKCG